MTAIPYGTIDTVFLDVGGTLLHLDFCALSGKLREHGIIIEPDDLERVVAASKPTLFRGRPVDSTEGEDAVRFYVRVLLEELRRQRFPELADVMIEGMITALAAWLSQPEVALAIWSHVGTGIPESLRALREGGLRLVVVSNSDGRVGDRLSDAGLLELVDGVIDSGIVGIEKPHPGIFHHALSEWEADPARTVHVGDLYEVDVLGARAAGVHAVLVDPYGDWDVDGEIVADVPDLCRRLLDAR